MIGLLGAVVIAFSLPQTSRMKGHVFMDFITDYLGATGKAVFHVITRMAGIALFAIISWNFYKFALDSYKLGEVTPTLQLPIYPVLFAIAVCCATQCLALFVDMLQPPESPQDSQS
jgi:TRAP-type C4-dicarboxylate transport system permease small subunit